ncbi:MAG: hypothetical protein ACRDHW_12415 [Ktedonobacteraceae bacterium]
MSSEVARLRERIRLECSASWDALHALNSGTAQHRFISARFKRMGDYHAELKELVGEEEATAILCEVFNEEGKGR